MARIEYFYAAHSAFAYLGSSFLAKIAQGHELIHRPMDLGQVVLSAGAGGFGARSPAHRAYYFRREIERWSEYRGAPVMRGRPTHHDNDIGLANCLLIAASEAGQDVQPLAHAMLQSHWRDDSDLADLATLKALVEAQGFDVEVLLAAAQSPEINALHRANTEEAVARSVFGSPTYFVDGDMFYGQDRLEMVARALDVPFKGVWP